MYERQINVGARQTQARRTTNGSTTSTRPSATLDVIEVLRAGRLRLPQWFFFSKCDEIPRPEQGLMRPVSDTGEGISQ
jgi:hypothetical protein